MPKHYIIEHMEPEDDAADQPLPEWVLLEYRHMLIQTGIYDSEPAKPPPTAAPRQHVPSASALNDLPLSRVTFSHLSKPLCEALTNALSAPPPPAAAKSDHCLPSARSPTPPPPAAGPDPGAEQRGRKPPAVVRHLRSLSGSSPEMLKSPDRVTCSVLSVFDLMSALRVNIRHVCLLDPKAALPLTPEDGAKFKWFCFGGILGDDPPRDRTAQLRAFGFPGRHLGAMQMTTDTAVAVTKRIVEDGKTLEELEWVDRPELKFGKRESVEMPFRYLKGEDGEPIMPEGMRELIRKDSEKSFDF